MYKVWIVDDDSSIRWVLARALRAEGFEVEDFEDAESVLNRLSSDKPDVLMTDIRMPGMSGLDLAENLRESHVDIPVIIMTAHTDLDSALASYESGAFEYLPKPFDLDEALRLVHRAVEPRGGAIKIEEDASDKINIIGEAPAMQEVFRAIGRLAKSNINVMVCGQSGTGKELVANALHQHSPRSAKPFVAINIAAIPAELLESELFGHEKGSFTGAQAQRKGRFEQADGGTLFLDEIGEMSEDLYHRLNVIRIDIPSLRERAEDVPLLVKRFLRASADELQVEMKTLSDEALAKMMAYDWPGNVRQLENMCRWITVMAPANSVSVEDLPKDVLEGSDETLPQDWESALARLVRQKLNMGQQGVIEDLLKTFEAIMLKEALDHTQGHRQKAAKLLGWGRNTLTPFRAEVSMDLT